MKIKKFFLTMAVLMMAIVSQAQDYIVTPERLMNPSIFNMDMRNIMELRDGGILANVQLFDDEHGDDEDGDYGCVFYKIEYDSVSASITDSVFIEDNDMNYFLLERNPLDNDNVFAKVVCDFDNTRSDLRIQFFDDNLNFKPEKEIWVPISDTLILPLSDDYILDKSCGDMLFHFKIKSRKEHHIFKVGLDGTVKAHKVMSYSENPVSGHGHMGIFNENPKQYCLWGLHEGGAPNPNDTIITPDVDYNLMKFVIMDSLLNVEKFIAHNSPPHNILYSYEWDSFLDMGDTTFLFFTKCDTVNCTYIAPDTCICNPHDYVDYNRVCLSKCGKSDARNYATRVFPYSAFPMEVKKTNDGNVYISSFTGGGGVRVTKLTRDMETVWESYCSGTQYFEKIVPLENGGVAVGGMNYDYVLTGDTTYLFFVIFKDGTFSLPENKAEERPYTFYPNPANNELNLNISPEVEPSLIELYDIQGRIVRSQQNGFEKVSLRGLPAGTYALRVSLKNGKSYTSTVVKK